MSLQARSLGQGDQGLKARCAWCVCVCLHYAGLDTPGYNMNEI